MCIRDSIKIDSPCVNIGQGRSIGDRGQLQVVPTLLHSAAAGGPEKAVSTVGDAVVRNLRPTCSSCRRLPDPLVGRHRVSTVIGLHIYDPRVYFVAPRHYRELAAIDQASRSVRSSRTQRRRKARRRLRSQRGKILAIRRRVQPVTADESVESPARALARVVNHRRSRGGNRTVRHGRAAPRGTAIQRVIKSCLLYTSRCV